LNKIEIDKCTLTGLFRFPFPNIHDVTTKFSSAPVGFRYYFPKAYVFTGDTDATGLCPEGVKTARFLIGLPVSVIPSFLEEHPHCTFVNARIETEKDVMDFIESVYTKFPRLKYHGVYMITDSIFCVKPELRDLYQTEIEKVNHRDIEQDALQLSQ
jgi:hypothetical protein